MADLRFAPALGAGRRAGLPVSPSRSRSWSAAAVLLSPVYLVLRAAEQGSEHLAAPDAIDVGRRCTLRTVLLTVTVTAACIAARRAARLAHGAHRPAAAAVWTVLLALPLAVPSFVGGFVMVSALGPGGMLQDLLEPLGVERLPSIYGFWGAWLTLTLSQLPLRLPDHARRAEARPTPPWRRRRAASARRASQTFLRVNLPLLRPAIAAGACSWRCTCSASSAPSRCCATTR